MRRQYDNTEWRGWLATTDEAGIVFYMADVWVDISGSEFQQLAAATDVRVELGTTAFEVPDDVMQALRLMAAPIALPAELWDGIRPALAQETLQ